MGDIFLSQAAGYFHWPPVWVGDTPVSENREISNDEVVLRFPLPQGITSKVLRQGIFIFDFSEASIGYIDPYHKLIDTAPIQQAIYRRIAVLNAHLLCLYNSLFEIQRYGVRKMIVTPSNLISYRSIEDHGGSSYESDVNPQIHYMKSTDGIPQELVMWKNKRSVSISLETVLQSYKLLGRILEHQSEDTLDLIHLYARSCKAYEDHNFDLSVVTAWTLSEVLLNVLWKRHLDGLNRVRPALPGKEKFINADRRRILTASNYSASVIIEILSIAGVIPSSLYTALNNSRKERNDWIHNLRIRDSEMAQKAIFLAGDMLRLIYGVELNIPLNLSQFF